MPPSSGTLYLLSQVDVDQATLADGTITSRLEAAIACRPAGTTLRPCPPARSSHVDVPGSRHLGSIRYTPHMPHRRRTGCVLSVLGTFISMIRSDDALPFNERTAQRLMKIAEHPVLTNTTHESHLPTSWTTLYELSKASPALLEAKISTGTITPRLERSQVARKIFGKIPKTAQHTLDRVKQLRGGAATDTRAGTGDRARASKFRLANLNGWPKGCRNRLSKRSRR